VSESELVERACETLVGYLALGNERFEGAGATFLRNHATPRRYDVNTVALVRAQTPVEVTALLRRVEDEYAGFRHRRFSVDPLTPPALSARLALEDGYKVEELLTLVLEGELRAQPRDVEVREALTEADWQAYRHLDELWWRESSTGYFGPYDPGLHGELMASFRAKAPALRSWLAVVDGAPRAFLSSWPGDNGVGMVEDLFTEPEYRHRGLATALLAAAVADARARGAALVIITADPHDSPRQMYAAMGFRPLLLHREYLKLL
jgi:GNAT superfamily N-acetyltransferase